MQQKKVKKTVFRWVRGEIVTFNLIYAVKEIFWNIEKNVAQYIQSSYPVNCHETQKLGGESTWRLKTQ